MSLNFDCAGIANYKEVTTSPFDEKKWHPVTEAIVWACIAVEIGKITEANSKEFFERLAMWQVVDGPWLAFNDGEGVYLTQADVDLHIGLTTNVFPNKTAKQFAAKLMDVIKRNTGKVKNRDGLSAHAVTYERATKGE